MHGAEPSALRVGALKHTSIQSIQRSTPAAGSVGGVGGRIHDYLEAAGPRRCDARGRTTNAIRLAGSANLMIARGEHILDIAARGLGSVTPPATRPSADRWRSLPRVPAHRFSRGRRAGFARLYARAELRAVDSPPHGPPRPDRVRHIGLPLRATRSHSRALHAMSAPPNSGPLRLVPPPDGRDLSPL